MPRAVCTHRASCLIRRAAERATAGVCVRACCEQAAVYLGGPEGQSEPGRIVHGFELDGARELAAGTRIFCGGMEAAVEAVLSGARGPLDFRFFIGQRTELSTADGAWTSIACARPLALKQCLGLPKPLWHEVLELCDGPMGELSRVELVKRPDLEDEDSDPSQQ